MKRALVGLLLAAGMAIVAVGCTSIPAEVAVDIDRLNQNTQNLLPKLEAKLAAVNSDTTATPQQKADAKHDLLLAIGTQTLADTLNKYAIAHSNADDVAKVKAARAAAATPTVAPTVAPVASPAATTPPGGN